MISFCCRREYDKLFDVEKKNSAPNKSRDRGRPKCTSDHARRQMILNCARRLFVEKGYNATTTDDIAACCRISKRTLYRLFPGKLALFAAVVMDHQRVWLDLPREDDETPVAEALGQIFMVQSDETENRECFEVLELITVEGRTFPELSEILQNNVIQISQTALADWLSLQCAKDKLRIKDTRASAKMLWDMVFGSIFLRKLDKTEAQSGKVRHLHIQTCIDVFLHGTSFDRRAR